MIPGRRICTVAEAPAVLEASAFASGDEGRIRTMATQPGPARLIAARESGIPVERFVY
jgi:hypothetical protein